DEVRLQPARAELGVDRAPAAVDDDDAFARSKPSYGRRHRFHRGRVFEQLAAKFEYRGHFVRVPPYAGRGFTPRRWRPAWRPIKGRPTWHPYMAPRKGVPYINPVVSSKPKATLKFWIAWPAAPFTRLSITATITSWPPGR